MTDLAKKRSSTEATALDSTLLQQQEQQELLKSTKKYFKSTHIWISILLFFLSAFFNFISPTVKDTYPLLIIYYLLLALSTISAGCGTSLLIAILFTLNYDETVGQWQTKILSQNIAHKIQGNLSKIEETIVNENKQLELSFKSQVMYIEKQFCSEIYKNLGEYLPKRRFPESNSPNPEYNAALTESFLNTYNYKFRGTQGILIPIRLEGLQQKKGDIKNLSVEVLIFDPQDNNSLKLHAREFYKDSNMSDDEKLEMVKESIFQAIVGLYEVKSITSIQLRLYRDSIFYRSEIFDDSVFITFYNQRQKFNTYPPSFQYDKKSMYYDIFNRDFKQTWDLTDQNKRREFSINTSINELEDFLRYLGYERNIEDLRSNYLEKKHQRIEQLNNF